MPLGDVEPADEPADATSAPPQRPAAAAAQLANP
jgi:hypothetical protein